MVSDGFQTPMRPIVSQNLLPNRTRNVRNIPLDDVPLMPNLDDIPLTPPPQITRLPLRPMKRPREDHSDEDREIKRTLF
jgi:hypothetical protein